MFVFNKQQLMIVYSCDHGHTIEDNWDDQFADTEQELEAELNDSWSGFMNDIWPTDSTYVRPDIMSIV